MGALVRGVTPQAVLSCAPDIGCKQCVNCATILASVAELLRSGEMDIERAASELEHLVESQSQGALKYDYTPPKPETPAAAAPNK